MKKAVATNLAPKAVGPYSQAIISGAFLFSSGQLPIDPKTGIMADNDIESQTIQSLVNVKGILESNGLGFEDVIKTTVFIIDMGYFGEMNKIYEEYFRQDPPARSCVQVSRLPKDALIEIEIIAQVNAGK